MYERLWAIYSYIDLHLINKNRIQLENRGTNQYFLPIRPIETAIITKDNGKTQSIEFQIHIEKF